MFVLRVIREERESDKEPFHSRVMNHDLGDYYEFCKWNKEGCFGMVLGDKTNTFKLRKNEPNIKYFYYIMNGNGGSFERIIDRG